MIINDDYGIKSVQVRCRCGHLQRFHHMNPDGSHECRRCVGKSPMGIKHKFEKEDEKDNSLQTREAPGLDGGADNW